MPPTKLNYEILNIKIVIKYYTSYIIHNVIFRPHWLTSFENGLTSVAEISRYE